MQAVVEGGAFGIPLYHGTSSVYLDSIERFGLGGSSLLDRFDAAALLKDLLAACDSVLAADAEWNACRFAAQWMVDQESFGDAANFQHGVTYLTPSRASAVGYALTNRLGSEFLMQIYRLYQLLADRHPQAIAERELDRHPLVELFGVYHKPLLVTAHGVAVDAVTSEGGGPPQDTIAKLQSFSAFVGDSGTVLNLNFRLRVPLVPGSFTVEVLDPKRERNPFEW